MDNHGKVWLIDQDQKLMEAPHLSNAYFSQSMGRSENAIKCRRSHLAAKMHQNDPSTSLEEYVGLMHGDLDHAQTLLQEWSEKRASLKSFMDTNRKRKAQQTHEPLQHQPQTSRFFHNSPPPQEEGGATCWHTLGDADKIRTICESIRDEGGNLCSVFNDPQFLPCLIQHYPGFEAYARVVQARALGRM